jgi:hypothetical protein
MVANASSGQIHLRLGDDSKRIDRYIEHLKKTIGVNLSRADAVRALLERGLSEFETETKSKKS